MEQRTEEWFAARVGKVTASRMADVVAKTKTGWGASRRNYLAELVAERLTGAPAQRFVNGAMQWGIETEAEARTAYEFYTDREVEAVGFVDHPNISMTGASPDGLVVADGMVEIKCPNTATHIDTLLGTSLDNKYLLQMQWQMACAGRQWCDFVSFDPRMPIEMQFYLERVERDADQIAMLEKNVKVFLGEIVTTVESLKAKYRTKAA